MEPQPGDPTAAGDPPMAPSPGLDARASSLAAPASGHALGLATPGALGLGLITDATSKADILSVVNAPPKVFFQVFARSMVRMGAIDVKTGSEGEIRKHCALVNKR